MAKTTVAKAAQRDMTHRSKLISKLQDKLWNEAAKAPMFCKQTTRTVTDAKGKTVKKLVKRTQRLIGPHSYQVSAAGVAQAISRDQQIECKRLGIKFARPSYLGRDKEGNEKAGGENKGVPICQAQFSPGYKFVVEQFIAAYVQECVETARETLQALHKPEEKKRLNSKITRLACTEVNQNIFGASALAPRDVYVVPLPKKKKSKKESADGEDADPGDEDYQPPTAEEQEAEEAEADADAAADEGGD
jgi:hypothetical protein